MPPVQVLLIDHNKLFREGLKLLLSGEKFEISGEAQTVAEGVTLVRGGLAPQLGHVTASFAPHSLQNVDPAGGSWPQSPQVMVIPA